MAAGEWMENPVKTDDFEAWLRAARLHALNSTSYSVSSHVDEIWSELANQMRVMELVEGFLQVASRAIRDDDSIRLGLALPMGASRRLRTAPPTLVATSKFEREPPSIYVFVSDYWRMPSDREEYRLPITLPIRTTLGFFAEYACGRSLADRDQGWEYAMTIWVFPR